MKSFWMILFALVLASSSFAQQACPDYDRLMQEAETYFKQNDYRNAYYKYNSAKACSPSKRGEVDLRITQLFEKTEDERRKAIIAELKVKQIYQQLLVSKIKEKRATERAIIMEQKQRYADSIRIAGDVAQNFANRYRKFVDNLADAEKKELLGHVVDLNRIDSKNYTAVSDTLVTSLQLLENAKLFEGYFFDFLKKNFEASKARSFFSNQSKPISDAGCVTIDIYYYRALAKISEALNLLPADSRAVYEPKIQAISYSLKDRREWLEQNYWLPDSVIGWPGDTIYARPSGDNQNFDIEYTSSDDYRKLQLRFLNLSVKDFSFTTDSLVSLNSKGTLYHVLAADADYHYTVVKEVPYFLKKNLAAYDKSYTNLPGTHDVIKLLDNKGNILMDFSNYSTNAYFFTSDANFLATWKDNSNELVLYNLKTQKFWRIPNAEAASTMSFSSDSKMMAYYNTTTKNLYFLDLTGTEPNPISNFSPGISGIWNIDFTGNNGFLKINTTDSTILYDIGAKKVVSQFQFHRGFVKDVIVAPNKSDVLIICNRTSSSYSGYLTYLVDINLNIKSKLFTDCENFFFSPDGKFIVGYDQYAIMRWQTGKPQQDKDFQTCLSFLTLVERDCLPYNYFLTINDADKLEQGARRFYTVANDTALKDPVLKNSYYLQSQLLWDRLKSAQTTHKERIPFFYDWYNFIGNILHNKDFSNQFSGQQAAVEHFDKLVNSAEPNYPQLLFYAANGNMLLANLYDSLHAYNLAYVDQIKKEISLREKVFSKDPDNYNNTWYFKDAFKRLSNVCDTVGWRNLQDKQYVDRLSLYRSEESYLSSKLKSLPDSFGLKKLYINVLAQLAPSYLYVYANKPEEYATGLDSALYFADKAFSLSPDNKFDSARLLIVKARAYLLKEKGPEKALELYRIVKQQFPNQISREGLLGQLRLLKEAGDQKLNTTQNLNIGQAEEFLRQE